LSYRDTRPIWKGIGALLTCMAAQLAIGIGGASGQTIIIPSITVSETYDSNVFFSPKSLLTPGSKPEDFITTITPQINVAHAGALLRGSLSVGGLVTKYMDNSDLDYTGINATGRLDLQQWAYKLSQRIISLGINGAYQFTPNISQFGAAGGAVGAGFGTTGIVSPISAGLVTNRVNMQTINLGATGGYQITRTTTLTGNYNYTKLAFGGQSGGVDNQLFGTQGHQGTTTLSARLNPRDTVGTAATLSHYIQGAESSSGESTFTTISGMGTWSRTWTQKLASSVAGGAIVTLPIESSIPGQSIKAQAAPTATASVNYTSVAEALRAATSVRGPFEGLPTLTGTLNPGVIIPAGQYTASMSYNFSVFPSYAFNAGPMKTHVIGANLFAGLTSKLSGQIGANFSHGSTNTPQSTFDSVAATAALTYLVGPVLASLSYNYMYFSNSATDILQNRSEYLFSKKMVTLSLSAAFNSQAFFRSGGFGGFGSTQPRTTPDGTSAPVTSPAAPGPSSLPSGSGLAK